MGKKAESSDCLDEDASRKRIERRRLRHKIVFQWVIPIGVGVFSFIYWFLLFPLVWSCLPVKEWHFLWFAGFGLAAFALWLAIIAPFVWLWHSRQDHIVELSPHAPDDAPYPTYPTRASTVQPKGYSVTYSPYKSGSQDSFIAVPGQKDGAATPSLYNSKTGRDSFQSGHYLDEEPALFKKNGSALDLDPTLFKKNGSVESASQTALTRENSAVQLSKKLPGEGVPDSHRPISVSSCSSASSGLDFKNIPRRPADGLDSADAQVETRPPLERDESFRGLPEMGKFDAYLHLVTLDTPLSPREEFFKDMGKEEEGVARRERRGTCHPGADLDEAQKRIAAARKSLPPLLHYPDLEIGEVRALKTATLPAEASPPRGADAHKATTLPPEAALLENDNGSSATLFENESETGLPNESLTKLVVENEVKQQQRRRTTTSSSSQSSAPPDEQAAPKRAVFRTQSEGRRLQQRRGSGDEFFVAQVARLDSVTSEAHIEVQEPEQGISRWDTRFSSIAKTPTSAGSEEGRFVVLKQEYAHNYVEAFITVEKEALGKERMPARGPSDEVDCCSDNVFLEF